MRSAALPEYWKPSCLARAYPSDCATSSSVTPRPPSDSAVRRAWILAYLRACETTGRFGKLWQGATDIMTRSIAAG
jgi:hypothetical protein